MLFLAAFPACGQKTFDEKMNSLYKETVPLIKASELKNRMDKVVLLDARAPEEFGISHLDGAILIDYNNFDKTDVIRIPKDTEVIVYCSVGYRSERIGEKLQQMGYTNVKNLYGGIFGWKNEGFNTVNKYGRPTDSVHTYNKSWSKWLFKGIKVYE